MKLLELFDTKRAKYKRGLKKSRSLRAVKDKQFEKPPEERLGKEVQG